MRAKKSSVLPPKGFDEPEARDRNTPSRHGSAFADNGLQAGDDGQQFADGLGGGNVLGQPQAELLLELKEEFEQNEANQLQTLPASRSASRVADRRPGAARERRAPFPVHCSSGISVPLTLPPCSFAPARQGRAGAILPASATSDRRFPLRRQPRRRGSNTVRPPQANARHAGKRATLMPFR